MFGRTLREAPAEAEHIGYQLVLRAALARQNQAGSFSLLPLGMRVARRIEAIFQEELDRVDGQEIRTPVIQSSAAWERSGRYATYGPKMLRLNDRAARSLIFGPTHEETFAELAQREITSYRQMPALAYQIHTKYRDELRAKGGLLRLREFSMLDAYSFDADADGLDRSYDRVAAAFERILERCGLRFVAVEASNGDMGGRESREYMALSPAGEDTLAICAECGYAANVEVAVSSQQSAVSSQQSANEPLPTAHCPLPTEVATPNCKTIADVAAFMGVPESATGKAVFFDTPERGLLFVVIRGDLEVNEEKLRVAAGVSALAPASAEQIAAAGAVAGYASPMGLSVQKDQRPMTNDQGAPDTSSPPSSLGPSSLVLGRSFGVFVVADESVARGEPLVVGANREGYHLRDVVYGRDWQATVVADIAAVRAGDPCARCGAPLRLEKGVEIAHVFKLGTHFAEALGASYLDRDGAARPIVMGSYGIGVERLLQVIVEQHHDDAGIVWPAEVAPLDVQLVRLGKSDEVRAASDVLYDELQAAGLRVLYDDRDETAGVKFNDADLIGLPIRLLVSERLLVAGQVELKRRSGGEATKTARAEVIGAVRSVLGQ
jgi:prolyl-tRNA synthetase